MKTRLTLRGSQQEAGVDYDETYGPVAELITLRVVLAIIAVLCLEIHQLDLKTAYLNARLKEEVYCMPTKDMVPALEALEKDLVILWQKMRVNNQIRDIKLGHMLKELMALYGLKQAPRAWFLTFEKSLVLYPTRLTHVFMFYIQVAGL